MMYEDGRFARHLRFCYFVFNTEMHWRALQAGRIHVHQHPYDAQLSVEELRGMVSCEGETFSNRVLHYATSLRGTWFKQQSRLIAMVDTLGLPTVFFSGPAADLQWPELARPICRDNPDSSSAHNKAVQENPAIADWFFHQRIVKFIESLVPVTTGSTSSGNIVAALTFMVLPDFPMLQTWRKCCPIQMSCLRKPFFNTSTKL